MYLIKDISLALSLMLNPISATVLFTQCAVDFYYCIHNKSYERNNKIKHVTSSSSSSSSFIFFAPYASRSVYVVIATCLYSIFPHISHKKLRDCARQCLSARVNLTMKFMVEIFISSR